MNSGGGGSPLSQPLQREGGGEEERESGRDTERGMVGMSKAIQIVADMFYLIICCAYIVCVGNIDEWSLCQ